MNYRSFPKEIKDKIKQRVIEQGNSYKASVFENSISAGQSCGGFTWSDTPEGDDFWRAIMDGSHDFDVFWNKYPKETKTAVDPTSLESGLFHPPFREGDIVKCVKNTFDGNTECIGKYFCLTAQNARELNNGGTAILNSYPSGERNEFEVNYSADLLIISNRSETILNNNSKILQHDRTHIQTASSTDSRSDCSIQGTIYSKSGFPQIRCGY